MKRSANFMFFTVSDILKITGGILRQGSPQQEAFTFSKDSRTVGPGDLYVALVGKNFDGHAFAGEAVLKGAHGVLVSREVHVSPEAFCIEVADTEKALWDLASAWRDRFKIPVIAVTGSSGKTTTKEMLAACLKQAGSVLKTEGNLNNLIGMPFTVFGLREDHDFAVLEMGMNAFGEITQLARIGRPTVGVITNVGPAHLEGLGSLAGVAKAKGELFLNLDPSATAVVNLDDPLVKDLPTKAKRLTFGHNEKAQVRCLKVEPAGEKTFVTVADPQWTTVFELPFFGDHLVSDWLACYAVCVALGIGPQTAQVGISTFKPGKRRGELLKFSNDVWIIDDCYNANPASMKAALKALRDSFPGRRAVAVLGEMLELGPGAKILHEEVGKEAGVLGIEKLLVCGVYADEVLKGYQAAGHFTGLAFKDTAGLAEELKKVAKKGDVILVKGSRGAHMEDVVSALTEAFAS